MTRYEAAIRDWLVREDPSIREVRVLDDEWIVLFRDDGWQPLRLSSELRQFLNGEMPDGLGELKV